MVAPAAICQSADGTIVPGSECGLSPKAVDAGFNDWKYLINFKPSDTLVSELRGRLHKVDVNVPVVPTPVSMPVPVTPMSPVWHDVRDGRGPINLDFYPVYIHDTPTIDGVKLDVAGVFDYLRKHICEFMTLDGVKSGGPSTEPSLLGQMFPGAPVGKPAYLEVDGLSLDAYEQQDADRWITNSPEGSVLHFHVGTLGASLVVPRNPDNLAVCNTEFVASDHWIFTTIWTPRDLGHAVSGHRQFGVATRHPADQLDAPYAAVFSDPVTVDTPYIYTRGADRCTTVLDSVLGTTVFLGGHNCWLGFCKNIFTWIEANGGKASIPGCLSDRHDWEEIKKYYGRNGS
jgi:hypothetical protein